MGTGPLAVEQLDGGAVWRVAIGGSKGNVLDAVATDALAALFREAAAAPHLKAICLEGQGPHFSFGASVQEHLPPDAGAMLARFHGAILAMLDSAVPVLAAVRGQCLGGALELVSVCHRVFAARDAKLGQPEILLGVFAPVASVVLADRVGRGAADDLCLSGRSVTADEAWRLRLVDEVADADPADAALAWARTHLLPKSASSLRYAVRAARASLRARLAAELPGIERLYLDGLMSTADALEGLNAFVERRPPAWRDA
ncbi:MAG: enoyl-CoA hydratase/isomerase family protein [Acidobacteria bacterium]|nr:enoyl-CoA hydratase/isomerase family protein [Acidobacteriota bacterium]